MDPLLQSLNRMKSEVIKIANNDKYHTHNGVSGNWINVQGDDVFVAANQGIIQAVEQQYGRIPQYVAAGKFKPKDGEKPDKNGKYWRKVNGRSIPFSEGEDTSKLDKVINDTNKTNKGDDSSKGMKKTQEEIDIAKTKAIKKHNILLKKSKEAESIAGSYERAARDTDRTPEDRSRVEDQAKQYRKDADGIKSQIQELSTEIENLQNSTPREKDASEYSTDELKTKAKNLSDLLDSPVADRFSNAEFKESKAALKSWNDEISSRDSKSKKLDTGDESKKKDESIVDIPGWDTASDLDKRNMRAIHPEKFSDYKEKSKPRFSEEELTEIKKEQDKSDKRNKEINDRNDEERKLRKDRERYLNKSDEGQRDEMRNDSTRMRQNRSDFPN